MLLMMTMMMLWLSFQYVYVIMKWLKYNHVVDVVAAYDDDNNDNIGALYIQLM